jgi:hypothetical protein
MLDMYYVSLCSECYKVYASLGGYRIMVAVNLQVTGTLCRSSSIPGGRLNMETFTQTQTYNKEIEREVATLQDRSIYALLEEGITLDRLLRDETMGYFIRRIFLKNSDFSMYIPFEGMHYFFALQKGYTPKWINCSERELKYDTIQENEFTPGWFKYVISYLDWCTYYQGTFGFKIIIPVTMDWFMYLQKYRVELDLCMNLHRLKRALEQCGDIESNPGPSYKNKFGPNTLKSQQHFEREIKTEMQIFGSLPASLGAMAGVANTYSNWKIGRSVDAACGDVTRIADAFSETCKTIREQFTHLTNVAIKGVNVLDLIIEAFFSIIQISMAKRSKIFYSVGVEIARLVKHFGLKTSVRAITDFVFGVFDVSTQTFKTTYNAIKQKVINAQMQMDFNPSNMAGYLIKLLFAIMGVAFVGFIPDQTHIEKTVTRMGNFSRNCKNMSDFNKEFHGALTDMLKSFQVNVLGIEPQEELEQFISGIDAWFVKTRKLLQRTEDVKKSDMIMNDIPTILEVEELYRQGLEFSKEIADKKLHRELQLPFQLHMKMLADLVKLVDTSGAFGTKPRTQPVVIWLFGESGVGKSGMSWPLAIDLNNIFMTDKEDARNFSKHIYMRNVEQEFWDNYQGQNVVIYDDFGQRKDSQAKPNEEFMELIRTANIAPYPLHMAHLEDKRKTRFVSKVLLMTSNVFEQNVDSLTFPDAFRRRIDFCGRVSNFDEFTKAGHSKQTGQAVQRLDKQKVRDEFGTIISTEVYKIDLVDPESGATLDEGLTYDEFLKLAVEKTQEAFKNSKELNDFLEDYAEDRFEKIKSISGQMQGFAVYEECDIECEVKSIDFIYPESRLINRRGEFKKGFEVHAEAEEVYMEEFTWSDEEINREEFILKYIQKEYKIMETKQQMKLLTAYQYFKKKSQSILTSAIEFAQNHPFIMVSGVIGIILTMLTLGSFWSSFWTKPEKTPTPMQKRKYGEVVECVYDNSEDCRNAIDCTKFSGPGLIDYLKTFAASTAVSTGLAFIFNKPDPMAYGLLSGLFDVSLVFIKDSFYHHGKKIVPVHTEASPSNDCITVVKAKPKIEADDEIRIMDSEASVSGDNITKAKPKATIEVWQEDGSWKYPADLQQKWEELGKPRYLGFIPNYSGVSGFFPTETFQEWKEKQAEASVSGDQVTKVKAKVVVEMWQPDGSFKYPANLKEEWEKLGRPKFFGIFPDYSRVPGFLPTETFEQWKKKQPKPEASVSGDNVTVARVRPKIEADIREGDM